MNKISFFKKKLATNSRLIFLFFLVFIFSLSLVKIAEAKNIGIGSAAADAVIIGTSADPQGAKLLVQPNTGVEGVRIITSNYSPFIIRNAANTADLFRIDQNGVITTGSLGTNSYWNLSGSNLYASSTSWNVGIGTASPAAKLDVYGSLRVYDDDDSISLGTGAGIAEILYNAPTQWQVGSGWSGSARGSDAFYFYQGGEKFSVDSDGTLYTPGSVGIGVTSPAAKLNVLGDIYADGTWENDIAFRIREGGDTNYGAFFKYGTADTLYIGTRHAGVDYPALKVSRSYTSVSFPGLINVTGASSFTQPLAVGVPTAANHAITKSYLESSIGSPVSSGTSGQTLRHNGSSWAANSLLYNNGTNVGVNTTAPNSTLDVNGVLSVSGKSVLYLPSNNPEVGPWNPIWSAIGASKPLYTDEEFASGLNSVSVYNNSGGSAITITRLTGQVGVPNSTGNLLRITYDGGLVSPGFGGFILGWNPVANRTYVQRFRAKLPVGRYLVLAENPQGSNNTSYWLTNTAGTGKWEDYIRISHAGNTGTFAGGGHVYVTGGSGAFTWDLASANVYEVNTPIISSPNTWASAQTFSGGAYFPGSGVWNTSGNVGIGSASPAYALDVSAAARFSSPLIVGTPTAASHAATKSYVDSSVGSYMPRNGGVNANFDIASNVNNSSYSNAAIELREYNHAGTLSGAASEAPRLSFHWGGRVASQIALETDGTIMIRNNPGTDYENFAAKNIHANGYLSSSDGFGTGGSISAYGDISSNGHISSTAGISTGSGNLEATLASDEGPSLILRNPNKSATGNYWSIYNMTGVYGDSLQFWSYGSSSSGGRLILSDTGNMTLYGDLNAYNLLLAGKTAIRGNTDTWLRINDTSAFASGTYFGSGILRTDGNFQVGSNGDRFTVLTNGKVGIGTTAPSEKLEVIGSVKATAFVYNSSDRTLKKNIATISNPIEKIMKLRGVTFDWKKDNSPSIGLIAQEVEKVFPELVTGEAGNKAVAYNNLVAPLIEAVKAQQKEIDELNTKINKLELKLKKASVTR